MASRPNYYPPEKNLTQVLNELKDEFKDFTATRLQMLRSEMNEKVGMLKQAVPALAIAAVMAVVALLFLSVALVAVIAMAFGNGPGAWAISFAIVGALYLLTGVVAGVYGYRALKARSMAPERTLRVLKEDQIWLKTEAKTQL